MNEFRFAWEFIPWNCIPRSDIINWWSDHHWRALLFAGGGKGDLYIAFNAHHFAVDVRSTTRKVIHYVICQEFSLGTSRLIAHLIWSVKCVMSPHAERLEILYLELELSWVIACPWWKGQAALPAPPSGTSWFRIVDTNLPSPDDFSAEGVPGMFRENMMNC